MTATVQEPETIFPMGDSEYTIATKLKLHGSGEHSPLIYVETDDDEARPDALILGKPVVRMRARDIRTLESLQRDNYDLFYTTRRELRGQKNGFSLFMLIPIYGVTYLCFRALGVDVLWTILAGFALWWIIDMFVDGHFYKKTLRLVEVRSAANADGRLALVRQYRPDFQPEDMDRYQFLSLKT